ncbi:MAG: A24 family peptidase [Planctomycetota bacterium]
MISATWGSYLLLNIVCITAAICDCCTGKVPNRLNYSAILVGLVFWPVIGVLLGGFSQAAELGKLSWLGMLAGLIPFALLVLTAGLGGGDMKLMAAIGAISASWQVVFSTALYALAVALLMAVVVMIRKGVVKQTLSRVLSAALLASARVKPNPPPRDSPTVPFAVAIAVGAAIAGAEQMLGWDSPWRAFSP